MAISSNRNQAPDSVSSLMSPFESQLDAINSNLDSLNSVYDEVLKLTTRYRSFPRPSDAPVEDCGVDTKCRGLAESPAVEELAKVNDRLRDLIERMRVLRADIVL